MTTQYVMIETRDPFGQDGATMPELATELAGNAQVTPAPRPDSVRAVEHQSAAYLLSTDGRLKWLEGHADEQDATIKRLQRDLTAMAALKSHSHAYSPSPGFGIVTRSAVDNLVTLNEAAGRVAMHGVRRSLLEAQSEAIGIPIWQIPLPWPCTNEDYERRMAEASRRAVEDGFDRIAFGDLVYDRESRRVWCAGREVQLTPRELRLFDILFLRAGAPVSAETLYDYVWREDGTHTSNSLAVYVGYLRRKLTGSRVAVVETLRGQGYRLSQRHTL